MESTEATGNVVIKASKERPSCSEAVITWLLEHGVARDAAVRFLIKSGCSSVRGLAVYLRMQLPPLQRANTACVDEEMDALLGVTGNRARKVIKEADVLGALNFNIHEAVSTHLYDTGSRSALQAQSTAITAPAQQQPVPAHSSSQLTISAPFNLRPSHPDPPPPGRLARLLAFLTRPALPYSAAALHIPTTDMSPDMPTHAVPAHATQAQPAADAISPRSPKDATAELSMSIALHPPASTCINRRVPGQPTASHELEPGPFHRANAALRRQLPPCAARVRTATRWDHVAVFALAAAALMVYLVERVAYLASGRSGDFEQLQEVSVAFSWAVLVAEALAGAAALYGGQLFWKQTVEYDAVDEEDVEDMATEALAAGARQTMHVLVPTFGEAAELARECVLRLLVAPEPVYMEKVLHLCDGGGGGGWDGFGGGASAAAGEGGTAFVAMAEKEAEVESARKAAMVEHLRQLGHTNVHYVRGPPRPPGDRRNPCSVLINHALRQIYPAAHAADDIPLTDVFMVVSCGHMAKPQLFNRVAPCMLDLAVTVAAVPPAYHDCGAADVFDAANADMFRSRLPYAFGAGLCMVPGTNAAIRTRHAVADAVGAAAPHPGAAHATHAAEGASKGGSTHTAELMRVFPEAAAAGWEHVEVGAQLHSGGRAAVAIGERLVSGEMPAAPSAPWSLRRHWLECGHLFPLSPNSFFFRVQPGTRAYQRALHLLSPAAHCMRLVSAPILAAVPFACCVLRTCPYGMDRRLFWSHLAHCTLSALLAVYHRNPGRAETALGACMAARALWFSAAKACVNTLLVRAGALHPGRSMHCRQAARRLDEVVVTGELVEGDTIGSPGACSHSRGIHKHIGMDVGVHIDTRYFRTEISGMLFQPESALECIRSMCCRRQMPVATGGAGAARHAGSNPDGRRQTRDNLDGQHACAWLTTSCNAWAPLVACVLAMTAAVVGIRRLVARAALEDWNEGRDSLVWLSVATALADALPGALYAGHLGLSRRAPQLLWAYYPLVQGGVAAGLVLVEVRLAAGFLGGF